jgi:hypothetical protein
VKTDAPIKDQIYTKYFFGNKNTKILHKWFCPFHPSIENVELYEDSIHAFIDGYAHCSYCFGDNGHLWERGNKCFQCEVYCSTWQDCLYLEWDENDQAICHKNDENWNVKDDNEDNEDEYEDWGYSEDSENNA